MGGGRAEVSFNGSIGVCYMEKKRLVPVNSSADPDSILVNFFPDYVGSECFRVPEVLSSAGKRCSKVYYGVRSQLSTQMSNVET